MAIINNTESIGSVVKMKILHINSYFNGSIFYKNLYDKQMKSGLDINVFVPVSSSFKSSKVDLGSYTITSINHGKFDRVFFYLKHYKIYKDVVKRYKVKEFSLIHAHSLFSNGYIAMKLKKEYELQYIVAVRNTDVNIFFEKMPHLRNLGILIIREAKQVIFLSESYRNLVIERYIPSNLKDEVIKKSHVIPNGIDDFWFRNLGEGKSLSENNVLKLLYVGNINKNKNVLTTIKAAEHLQEKGLKIQFTIVGSVKDKNIYKKIKKEPWIKYISPKPKEELLEIYRKNDIFVMPSLKETFGLVYVEAMSQGLPVIYTKGQGFDKQFKEGEIGFSVNSLDSLDIVKRIESILNQYEILSHNCVKKSTNFKWNRLAAQYNDIYYL